MNPKERRLVLGSRSPRRLELLRQIWPAELIDVVPPTSTAEAHFKNLHDWKSIERRLLEIAGTKCDDVAAQLRNGLGDLDDPARFCDADGRSPSPPTPLPRGERGEDLRATPRCANGAEAGTLSPQRGTLSPLAPGGLRRAQSSRRGVGGEGAHDDSTAPVVVTADTIVIVERAGGLLHVLGQPPADDSWPEVVRRWFREDYAGKTHVAATAVCADRIGQEGDPSRRISRVVTSRVTFSEDVDRWLDWYLATGEPRGKAGGYALQGAGSVFIAKVEGSLSNVVGLPLAELLEMLAEL
jgi:predicted house-cleaning NTP pyrophosphatase (Maf/HAM1 superfamily)